MISVHYLTVFITTV